MAENKRFVLIRNPDEKGIRPVTLYGCDPSQGIGTVPGWDVGTIDKGVFVIGSKIKLNHKIEKQLRTDVRVILESERS